jgi:hypothetical protein
MALDPLQEWHRILATRDAPAIPAVLADEVTFHSPVVHTPQRGRLLTAGYLGAALQVFGNDSFRYVREFRAARSAVLEFTVEIDGIHVNGVDMIAWNEAGLVVDFKVMLRPLKAVNLIREKMAAVLAARAPHTPRA